MVGGDPGCARGARCRPARRRGAAAPARVHAGRDRRRARPAARHCELAPPARARPARRPARGGGAVRRSAFKRRLRDDLHAATPPRAAEAERRAWEVVRAAHSERDAVRRPTGPRRLAVAALAAALAAVLVLSPAGAKVGDWIGDVVDPSPEATRSTLASLPAPGRLLVVGPGGPWVVDDAELVSRRVPDRLPERPGPVGRGRGQQRRRPPRARNRPGAARVEARRAHAGTGAGLLVGEANPDRRGGHAAARRRDAPGTGAARALVDGGRPPARCGLRHGDPGARAARAPASPDRAAAGRARDGLRARHRRGAPCRGGGGDRAAGGRGPGLIAGRA